MMPGQDLTDITANVLLGLRSVLKAWRPEWVLVHGDTTTTLATSLAAYYEKVSVGHVEAGLRTRNIYSPWPEEMNRRIAGAISTLHFAPTQAARDNLLSEAVDSARIYVTGNTVIDALFSVTKRLREDTGLASTIAQRFSFLDKKRRIVLVTGHRRENFGFGFENICGALDEISRRDDVEIVYPVHLNPHVQGPVNRMLSGNARVHLLEPLDYLPFVYLMNHAWILLTDSGGIQEEAISLGKHVLVLREKTERMEGIWAGFAKLVGTNKNIIINTLQEMIHHNVDSIQRPSSIYGDGYAADTIVEIIKTMEICT